MSFPITFRPPFAHLATWLSDFDPAYAATDPANATNHVTTPPTTIDESDDAVVLNADMPGVSASGVEISLLDDVLTVRGTRGSSPATQGPGQATRAYARTFRLGPAIDTERISATAQDGVVRVTLPKRAAAAPRRIAVATA